MIRFVWTFAIAILMLSHESWAGGAVKSAPPKITADIVYVTRDYVEPLPLSLMEPIITDKGIVGARQAIAENLTTGRILGHGYTLEERVATLATDLPSVVRDVLIAGKRLIVADLEAPDLIALADMPEAKDAIILNARSSNDDLRGVNCRQNVFHVAPSWAMRADAIAQYMAWKQWKRWFLVHGEKPADLEYVAALERSAKRFGSKIVEKRSYSFDAGNRRTDTGHQQIQTQMPQLTQGAVEHDIMVVVDVEESFGEYLMWRTSVAMPTVGTQGLMALAWHRSYEQYGGMQLHSRFEKAAKRSMVERDYMAWLAVRVFGEAVTRSGKSDAAGLRAFLMSKEFQVAGFKGVGLNFRHWDRQLRQPLLLTGPRTLVSMSPQDGFLHEKFLTDTLGFDEPETKCRIPN